MLTGKEYTYIWVDLTDVEFQETLDAKKLCNNMYEVLEIPFYAENLNQYDIVECKDIDEVKHDFVKVVKSSGYHTVHIEFPEWTNSEFWLHYIQQLESKGTDWANSGRFFSISIPPIELQDEILQLIQEWEQSKVLKIEAVNKGREG